MSCIRLDPPLCAFPHIIFHVLTLLCCTPYISRAFQIYINSQFCIIPSHFLHSLNRTSWFQSHRVSSWTPLRCTVKILRAPCTEIASRWWTIICSKHVEDNLRQWPTWYTLDLFYNTFIIILYMFRALYAHHQEVDLYWCSIWYRHSQ